MKSPRFVSRFSVPRYGQAGGEPLKSSVDKEDAMSNAHFRSKSIVPRLLLLLAAVLGLLVITPQPAQAQTLTTLYSFTGMPDGAAPYAGVIMDAQGNLYGTTQYGGAGICTAGYMPGCGTVFKLTPGGTETIIFNKFSRHSGSPSSGLIWDASGNLYGTTGEYCWYPRNRRFCTTSGTVFELRKLKKRIEVKWLYRFSYDDGTDPMGGLVMDGQRNLYGTTSSGGAYSAGTVFELTPAGTETVLHSFAGGSDGENPEAGLTRDAQGNLYGTTVGGRFPCAGSGCGAVFMVTPGGSETVLYSFTGGTDGSYPLAGLVLDPQGNLYGTTWAGGGSTCNSGEGCGVVFELTAGGTETVLYSFCPQYPNCTDGAGPTGNLLLDAQGNLYGATIKGGAYGQGAVFELTPAGQETVLYSFTGGTDGADPGGNLILNAQGNLYGTTVRGGIVGGNCGSSGCGTVFKLTP